MLRLAKWNSVIRIKRLRNTSLLMLSHNFGNNKPVSDLPDSFSHSHALSGKQLEDYILSKLNIDSDSPTLEVRDVNELANLIVSRWHRSDVSAGLNLSRKIRGNVGHLGRFAFTKMEGDYLDKATPGTRWILSCYEEFFKINEDALKIGTLPPPFPARLPPFPPFKEMLDCRKSLASSRKMPETGLGTSISPRGIDTIAYSSLKEMRLKLAMALLNAKKYEQSSSFIDFLAGSEMKDPLQVENLSPTASKVKRSKSKRKISGHKKGSFGADEVDESIQLALRLSNSMPYDLVAKLIDAIHRYANEEIVDQPSAHRTLSKLLGIYSNYWLDLAKLLGIRGSYSLSLFQQFSRARENLIRRMVEEVSALLEYRSIALHPGYEQYSNLSIRPPQRISRAARCFKVVLNCAVADLGPSTKAIEESQPENYAYKVFLDNIPFGASAESIRASLRNCGEVSELWMYRNKHTVYDLIYEHSGYQLGEISRVQSSRSRSASPSHAASFFLDSDAIQLESDLRGDLDTLAQLDPEKDLHQIPVMKGIELAQVDQMSPTDNGFDCDDEKLMGDDFGDSDGATAAANPINAIKKSAAKIVYKAPTDLMHAFVTMANEASYDAVLKDDIQCFGICVMKSSCRVKDASKLKTLFVEFKSIAKVSTIISLLKRHLSPLIKMDIPSDNTLTQRPYFVHLEFGNHDQAWWAYSRLKEAINRKSLEAPKSSDHETHSNSERNLIDDRIDDVEDVDVIDDSDAAVTASDAAVKQSLGANATDDESHILQMMEISWVKSTWYKAQQSKQRRLFLNKFDFLSLNEKAVDFEALAHYSLDASFNSPLKDKHVSDKL